MNRTLDKFYSNFQDPSQAFLNKGLDYTFD